MVIVVGHMKQRKGNDLSENLLDITSTISIQDERVQCSLYTKKVEYKIHHFTADVRSLHHQTPNNSDPDGALVTGHGQTRRKLLCL
ncbi:hypothetical protein TNCV_1876211 [Trichonephila clavipes]|nr:hypothetical protein TNCV_1876211 [Trichonephila clavipes]